MKNDYFSYWHLGFFFWVFGIGIFSIPSFADIQEVSMGKTAFEYLLEKNEMISTEQTMLLSNHNLLLRLSLPVDDVIFGSELFLQNRDFLVAKQENYPVPQYSDDMKIIRDITFFESIDIWAYLDSFDVRERGLNQYIAWGNVLLAAIDANDTQKTAQQTEIKAKISALKKDLSRSSDAYTDAIVNADFTTAEIKKAEKAEISRQISLLESSLEAITKKTKQISSSKKTIEQRVKGATENRDALIKNVKIKLPSAEYVNIVEE